MHFLTTEGMPRDELEALLDLSNEFVEVLERPIPKVPALRGKTVTTMFFEASTRTRLSFERAAKALSADTMTFSPGTSALSKGESLKDTALTLEAMGSDLMVVRHTATGAPWRIAEWVRVPVVNGGDGANQHPTQALLDALTIRRHFGKVEGLRVAIVGDIRHSRVARSDLFALSSLGAEVVLVAPRTLLPVDLTGWPTTVAGSLDELLGELDVVYLLRVQTERGGGSVFPSLPEYVSRYGLTRERFERLRPEAVVMHPGPMNRGVEIAPEVADHQRSLITQQVTHGVAVRMAVLFRLLGGLGGHGGPEGLVGEESRDSRRAQADGVWGTMAND
jgi:aspartate carbamoyltransferase catalytic subunit